jgi:hypothetical protein
MRLAQNLPELQKAADYICLRRVLRLFGRRDVIFGLAAAVIGYYASSLDLYSFGRTLFPLGAFLLLAGVFTIALPPKPAWIILSGAATSVVGCWYFVVVFGDFAEEGINLLLGSLGMLYAGYGILAFSQYQRFADALLKKPPVQLLEQVAGIVRDLAGARARRDKSVIRFRTGTVPLFAWWRGKLLEDAALFILHKGARQDIVFAGKKDVLFEKRGAVPKSGKMPVWFHLGRIMMLPGKMSREYITHVHSYQDLIILDSLLPACRISDFADSTGEAI